MNADFAKATEAGGGREPLGVVRLAAYGAGDFAFNLSFTFCSLFLLYFYTDVLEIDASTAGFIIMVALIWEGVTDPVIGMIANRTRTRWGRYRPYLLLGAVPLALSVIAMFFPTGLTGGALVAYCLVTHLVYRTVFTLVNIPYIALSAQLTSSSEERGKLAGTRMLFAIACGLVLASMTLPLAKAMGGGASGFFLVSVIYSVVATAILLLCFASTREPPIGEDDVHPTVRDMIAALKTNRAFLLLVCATVLGTTGYTMSGKALVYYLKYWSGSEAAVTLGLVVMLGSAAIAMVPWMLVSKRTSKRTVWLSGAGLNILAYLVILILAPRSGPLLWLALVSLGVGNSAFILTFWSMVPDTVEFGEFKSRVRSEGAVFGLIAFSQKVALGLGTGLIGILLDAMGYVANQQQSPETLKGIVTLFGGGPLLLFLGSVIAIWRYPINSRLHQRLVRAVEWRRGRRPR